MVKHNSPAGTGELLDELSAFRVVLSLDVFIVVEPLVRSRVLVILEPVDIKRHGILFSAQILDL